VIAGIIRREYSGDLHEFWRGRRAPPIVSSKSFIGH
jgi:hypothetical protein